MAMANDTGGSVSRDDLLRGNSPQEGNAFSIPIRVYIEDTDAGGVVYHANYLRYFERVRSDWLRDRQLTQSQLAAARVQFVVKRCSLDYRRPARLDDELMATAAVSQSGRASITFSQQLLRGEELLCVGEVQVACVSADTLKLVRLPSIIYEHLINNTGETGQ